MQYITFKKTTKFFYDYQIKEPDALASFVLFLYGPIVHYILLFNQYTAFREWILSAVTGKSNIYSRAAPVYKENDYVTLAYRSDGRELEWEKVSEFFFIQKDIFLALIDRWIRLFNQRPKHIVVAQDSNGNFSITPFDTLPSPDILNSPHCVVFTDTPHYYYTHDIEDSSTLYILGYFLTDDLPYSVLETEEGRRRWIFEETDDSPVGGNAAHVSRVDDTIHLDSDWCDESFELSKQDFSDVVADWLLHKKQKTYPYIYLIADDTGRVRIQPSNTPLFQKDDSSVAQTVTAE